MKKKSLLVVVMLSLYVAIMLAAPKAHALGGATVYEIGASTPAGVPVLVCSSACTLYDIEFSTATGLATSDYVVAFNSASINGYAAGTQEGSLTAPKLASLTVTTANAATSLPSKQPRNASNGLVVIKSALRNVQIIVGQ